VKDTRVSVSTKTFAWLLPIAIRPPPGPPRPIMRRIRNIQIITKRRTGITQESSMGRKVLARSPE
jgi:hypothetical protein